MKDVGYGKVSRFLVSHLKHFSGNNTTTDHANEHNLRDALSDSLGSLTRFDQSSAGVFRKRDLLGKRKSRLDSWESCNSP